MRAARLPERQYFRPRIFSKKSDTWNQSSNAPNKVPLSTQNECLTTDKVSSMDFMFRIHRRTSGAPATVLLSGSVLIMAGCKLEKCSPLRVRMNSADYFSFFFIAVRD